MKEKGLGGGSEGRRGWFEGGEVDGGKGKEGRCLGSYVEGGGRGGDEEGREG